MPERDHWDVQEDFMADKVWDTGEKTVPQPSPEFPDAKPQEYQKLTRKQRITLAEDIYNGDVFTDRHCRDSDEVKSVFMVLFFMDAAMRERLRLNPPGMVYEYNDKAGPMAVNGKPNFFSMRMLSLEEATRVMGIYQMLVNRKGQPSERERV
jgi:hypothetical protein